MKINFVFVTLLVMLSAKLSLCQAPSYIHEGGIGDSTESYAPGTWGTPLVFSFRPFKSWVGEKFIFMPIPVKLQQFGYQSFKGLDELYSWQRESALSRGVGDEYGHPTYEECGGNICTVVKASHEVDPRNSYRSEWVITVEMDSTHKRYTATSSAYEPEFVVLHLKRISTVLAPDG